MRQKEIRGQAMKPFCHKRKKDCDFLPAPPRWSACLYVRLEPKRIGMFRFLLEAEDNLGYMTVVDRNLAVLRVVCSPCQDAALRDWLEIARTAVPLTILAVPGL